MKKGSRARHCASCGRIVFWVVPTGEQYLGIHVCEQKTVLPWKYISGKPYGRYVCKDCLSRIESGE